jgi:anti-sigma factor RsiW
MTSADASLDERIWAYIRGEGSHAERKAFEAEVSNSPPAARRYATLKLKQQRQAGKLGSEAEATSKSASKSAPKQEGAKLARAKGTAGKFDVLILALAVMLLLGSGGLYLARGNWSLETLAAGRDGVHVTGLLLGAAVILLAKQGRLGVLGASALLVVAGCVVAVLAAVR